MVRCRTIALAAALVACRASAPAVAVRAPDPTPPRADVVVAPAPSPAPAPAGPEPSLAAGRNFACELRRDATVWCWGDNLHGELGDGTRASRTEPRRVEGLTGVTQLAAWEQSVCAVTGEGRVLCWGAPLYRGGAARGDFAAERPEAMDFHGEALEVAISRLGVCARLRGGSVACRSGGTASTVEPLRGVASLLPAENFLCGRMPIGALRCARASHAEIEVPALGEVRAVVSAGDGLVALRADGSVARLSVRRGLLVADEEARGATALWGSGAGWCFARDRRLWCRGVPHSFFVGGHGVQGSEPEALPVAGLRDPRSAAVGGSFACAYVAGDDAPRCWGAGNGVAVANGAAPNPHLVLPGEPMAGAADLATRHGVTCALFARGAPRCWGATSYGAVLGTERVSAGLPIAREVFGASADAMAWEPRFACAAAGATVRCVGARGGQRRAGTGWEREPDFVAQLPAPAAVRSVAVNGGYVCAALVDGRVACARRRAFEPLPANTAGAREAAPLDPRDAVLVAVPGLEGVTRVVARDGLTCALSDAGPARCEGVPAEWDFAAESEGAWAPLPHLGALRSLAYGEGHACAVDAAGAVWCWGRGRSGQLGGGVFSERARPARVALAGAADEVAVGARHSCARVAGAVWCWGANDEGQLGDGTFTMRTEPVRVAGVEGATRVAADESYTCALAAGGRALCWGAGDQGRLGDGWGGPRATPGPVRGD
ncbi:MAG: hypothetical protein U0324_33905 [Polyangiales bacterium]